MTKEQINDYAKVQPLVYLKLWIDDTHPDGVPDDELLVLDFKYAYSDIDYLYSNLMADYDNACHKQLCAAKAFLCKYKSKR